MIITSRIGYRIRHEVRLAALYGVCGEVHEGKLELRQSGLIISLLTDS